MLQIDFAGGISSSASFLAGDNYNIDFYLISFRIQKGPFLKGKNLPLGKQFFLCPYDD